MPTYKYVAKDYSLSKVSGDIQAVNEKEARINLKDQNLFVLEIKEVKEKKEKRSWTEIDIIEVKVKIEELSLFSRQFATLIDAGVQISRALNILAVGSQNKTLKKVLAQITEDIENGHSLSDAFAKHPKVFPELYINMLAAAELAGALPEVLDRLAIFLETQKGIKAKVKSAFVYPTVVFIVAIIAIVIILMVVIPQFIPIFEDLGEDLPLPTKILLVSSDFIIAEWPFLLIGAVVLVGFSMFYFKTKVGKRNWDWLSLKIPILGNIVQKSAIARFSRTLETLQKSGVPLIEAIEIVAKTSGNFYIERDIASAQLALERGEGISTALAKSKLFPHLVVQMIEIGEETGELDKLLSKVADFYEEEVDLAVKGLTALLEPVIMVFLGVMIGFIAVAVIMPMYGMMGAMQEGL